MPNTQFGLLPSAWLAGAEGPAGRDPGDTEFLFLMNEIDWLFVSLRNPPSWSQTPLLSCQPGRPSLKSLPSLYRGRQNEVDKGDPSCSLLIKRWMSVSSVFNSSSLGSKCSCSTRPGARGAELYVPHTVGEPHTFLGRPKTPEAFVATGRVYEIKRLLFFRELRSLSAG